MTEVNIAQLRERIELTHEVANCISPPVRDPLCHVLASELTALLDTAEQREPVAVSGLIMRREMADSPTAEESRAEFDALSREVWRLRELLRNAENERNTANDALTSSRRATSDMTDQRDRLRAGLDVAERWLRTLTVNPTDGCAHAIWAREAQGDITSALARRPF